MQPGTSSPSLDKSLITIRNIPIAKRVNGSSMFGAQELVNPRDAYPRHVYELVRRPAVGPMPAEYFLDSLLLGEDLARISPLKTKIYSSPSHWRQLTTRRTVLTIL